MLTGLLLAVGGLVIGLTGASKFNFGIMIGGWLIACIGTVLFVTSFVHLP